MDLVGFCCRCVVATLVPGIFVTRELPRLDPAKSDAMSPTRLRFPNDRPARSRHAVNNRLQPAHIYQEERMPQP
jgi:hypothetical protein